jgi:hypothetical protein
LTKYLNVEPSKSHLCDMARSQLRANLNQITHATTMRDRELAKQPANMAVATQKQANAVFNQRMAELMREIMEESCGPRP